MAKRKGPKTLEDVETQKAVKAAMNSYNATIIGDEARRSQECMNKIQEILKRYDCMLVPRCILSPQGAEFMIEALPRPPQQSTDAGKKATGYAGVPNASQAGQMRPQGKGGPKKKGKKG